MSTLLPRISVITPSFNQAQFLERTICSVLSQGYPNLEYIIIDGGSTDGSVDIIQRYSSQLTYWESTPDRGQSHAINKGLQRATGDWICWQNSDDIFFPQAFKDIAHAINRYPELDLIIGDIHLIDSQDALIRRMCYVRPTYEAMLAEGMILTNQAAFWKRKLHDQLGWLDEDLHYGFDFEWFLRLLEFTDSSHHIPQPLGALRYHGETKTSLYQEKFKSEYQQILNGRNLSSSKIVMQQLRRLLLTLANGEYEYVLNGIKSRIASKISNKQ